MRSKGQSVVEYGLILALGTVVSIASLQVLGNSIYNQLSSLAGTITHSSGNAVTAAPQAATTGQSSHIGCNGDKSSCTQIGNW